MGFSPLTKVSCQKWFLFLLFFSSQGCAPLGRHPGRAHEPLRVSSSSCKRLRQPSFFRGHRESAGSPRGSVSSQSFSALTRSHPEDRGIALHVLSRPLPTNCTRTAELLLLLSALPSPCGEGRGKAPSRYLCESTPCQASVMNRSGSTKIETT